MFSPFGVYPDCLFVGNYIFPRWGFPILLLSWGTPSVSTMTTPEDAKDLLLESQATFAPVVGAPNDDDAKRLYKAFVNALQSIDVPGGEVDLSNILLSDGDHKNKHVGRTLDQMETSLKSYDDGIAADATNAIRAKAERLWTAMIEIYSSSKPSNAPGAHSSKQTLSRRGSSPSRKN